MRDAGNVGVNDPADVPLLVGLKPGIGFDLPEFGVRLSACYFTDSELVQYLTLIPLF